MNSAGYRAEVVSAYQTVGGAPYLDYTDTVLGQVYEGMDVVDTIAQAAVDENQKPRKRSPSTASALRHIRRSNN